MRVLFINTTGGTASHGRIAFELAKEYESQGHTCKIAYGRNPSTDPEFQKMGFRIGDKSDIIIHGLKTRLFDAHGFGSKGATKKFLKWADEFNPDMVWLHNIHGYYINIEMLFNWIKSRPNMEVKWTLHDCWAFTGHCAYFTMAGCYKWKEQCSDCCSFREYPSSLFVDNSYKNFQRKKEAFSNVKNMTLITPSNWLADLVKQSFLKDYPIRVNYNEADSNIFKPTKSDFRDRYNLSNKKVVLGVANIWDERKGLKDFIELSKMLSEEYKIVLVGLSEHQIKNIPSNVLGLSRTKSATELAQIYTMADLYVTPSKEETFGMTTLEATMCGTKAIVYKGTACEEVVNKIGGVAVEPNVYALYREITGTDFKK